MLRKLKDSHDVKIIYIVYLYLIPHFELMNGRGRRTLAVEGRWMGNFMRRKCQEVDLG